MKNIATLVVLTSASLALVACGSSDDASTEATPDTVEMPADEALEPIIDEPVEDPEAAGPPADPADSAPDLDTTEEAADAAADVAAEAAAAAEAAEAASAAAPEE